MAYSIIRSGGKQFRVQAGDVIRIPSLADKNAGDSVEFGEVLATAGDGGLTIGAPLVSGAKVTGTGSSKGARPKSSSSNSNVASNTKRPKAIGKASRQ